MVSQWGAAKNLWDRKACSEAKVVPLFEVQCYQCTWWPSQKCSKGVHQNLACAGTQRRAVSPRSPHGGLRNRDVRLHFLLTRLARWTSRQHTASPEDLYFILKTITEAASNIQGLRDAKMTHKSVLLKPKGKEIQGQADWGINHDISWSKHQLCARPRVLSPDHCERQALWFLFYKWGTEAQTIRKKTYYF